MQAAGVFPRQPSDSPAASPDVNEGVLISELAGGLTIKGLRLTELNSSSPDAGHKGPRNNYSVELVHSVA